MSSQNRKRGTRPKASGELTPETHAIRRGIEKFLNTRDEKGAKIGDAKCGVYAFYDYYGEPIYVGQTKENIRTRIRRHLTNQRTDAVAMAVLDPVEVAEVEVWPLSGEKESSGERKGRLNRTEYTVYKKVMDNSELKAVLNEKDIVVTELIHLSKSHRARIVPDEIFESRKHPDVRIARRATKIAELATIVTERKVSKGLRRTLHLQARRLEWLAKKRLDEIGGVIPVEAPGEETGE